MATSRQVGLRLDENDDVDLKRIAQMEGRSEQEVLRDSLRMYVRSVDEHKQFLDSVERGWYELRSGLGEVVTEDDQFFQSLREELKKRSAVSSVPLSTRPACELTRWGWQSATELK